MYHHLSLKYVLVCLFLLLLNNEAQAQIRSIILGVNGLHCSACSYGTEQALRHLDFIKDISMDLNKHEATITFQPGKDIDLKAVAQKVVDAGFTVRDLYLMVDFYHFAAKDQTVFSSLNINLHFIKIKEQTLEAGTQLQVIGSDFMSKSAYKKWKDILQTNSGIGLPPSVQKNEYYVTL